MFSANSSQVSGDKLFVEDVFSTWLYTGSGGTQTITNGIDLAGKGGLVWLKERSANYPDGHWLFDTSRGTQNLIKTNTTEAQQTIGSTVTAFNSTGFSIGPIASFASLTYASWTFREAPKFFDVVTYTGDGANRNIAHNLGIAPGCIIVKRTDTAADWQVYHRSNANTQYMVLNSTATAATGSTRWNSTTPTATEFTVGTDATVNASGGTYVAYLFAHDPTADGFIQCGSYVGTGAGGNPVSLGWEPQWLMVKRSTVGAANWQIIDNMRGMPVGSADAVLAPNLANAEASADHITPTATGFELATAGTAFNSAGSTYIYIAIRRGPMRTPTLGTSVFLPIARNGTNATATITTGFTVDLHISKTRTVANSPGAFDRLRGAGNFLNPASTAAQDAVNYLDSLTSFANNTGVGVGADSGGGIINFGTRPYANWAFRRAPGFMDVVCYTGNGTPGFGGTRAINHNLGVAPELVIVKNRSGAFNWSCYYPASNIGLILNGANASFTPDFTGVSATTFTVIEFNSTNASGSNYVAYLFASCPGVSKVGSYTGNGSSQTINCGFAAGARFVMIKRTDSTGDWYVWDTARGIVAGNDPYLALNDISAEVTTNDSVDTDSSGFVVNQDAATNVNVNAATYIYLAIA